MFSKWKKKRKQLRFLSLSLSHTCIHTCAHLRLLVYSCWQKSCLLSGAIYIKILFHDNTDSKQCKTHLLQPSGPSLGKMNPRQWVKYLNALDIQLWHRGEIPNKSQKCVSKSYLIFNNFKYDVGPQFISLEKIMPSLQSRNKIQMWKHICKHMTNKFYK